MTSLPSEVLTSCRTPSGCARKVASNDPGCVHACQPEGRRLPPGHVASAMAATSLAWDGFFVRAPPAPLAVLAGARKLVRGEARKGRGAGDRSRAAGGRRKKRCRVVARVTWL